jgi:hypothetical protein
VKVTEDAPLAAVRDAGTVRAELLLDTETEAVVPAGTDSVRVTVQAMDVWGESVPAAHTMDEIAGGAMSDIVDVDEDPLREAVRLAV